MTSFLGLFALTATAQKFLGGDISLLPTYEEHNAHFMTQDGAKIPDLLDFFKQKGWNCMRVRLFVEPSRASDEHKGQGVHQDLDYVTKLGRRIKEAGLKFMLDFHYSDTWADPAHQATPYQFLRVNTPAYEYIYDYTRDCLRQLVEAGATPDFIQTGNEISWGMMYDSGCKLEHNSAWNGYNDTHWNTFATALRNAGRACREVCPDAKIIIHTEQAANTSFQPTNSTMQARISFGTYWKSTSFRNCRAPEANDSQLVEDVLSISNRLYQNESSCNVTFLRLNFKGPEKEYVIPTENTFSGFLT